MRCSAQPRIAACVCGFVLLSGCASDALNLAPPSASAPWLLPETPAIETSLLDAPPAARNRIAIDTDGDIDKVRVEPGHPYTLAELIDLAQRSNPQTREAWEKARQAALAVGLVQSSYAPQLSAEVLAGYQHTPLPIPTSLIPKGYFIADSREVLPTLALKWLLFDFGGRAGAEDAARAASFVANVAFTGAHEKLIFAVSRDYYALAAARGKRQAAEQSVKTAEVVEDAVKARRKNGLATVVELAQASRQLAQTRFNLERATGAEHASYQALRNSIGIDPEMPIEVGDASVQSLPAPPAMMVERYVTQALSNRPDVRAALGKVRAAEALLRKERASHYPTIALAGHVYQNFGDTTAEGSPHYSVNKPGGDIAMVLSLPLFDGGQRDARIALASSELAGAQAALDESRDTAVKQVRDAYDAVTTALAECASAQALVEASRSAYDSALDAYRHGVGTYLGLVNEESALAQASSDAETARADALSAASALAFATGTILRRGTY